MKTTKNAGCRRFDKVIGGELLRKTFLLKTFLLSECCNPPPCAPEGFLVLGRQRKLGERLVQFCWRTRPVECCPSRLLDFSG